ncbi:Uncharacterized protein PHPALM_37222 [Phytophthora palmivora]|uniref:Reverse transcriptase Ty1/copia-type domain-containing protein n=1 Tax=Phytophthora palmivora TaxID=4796 RepID=A0A2P4WXZ4_9STRA|nr:Uncharacterized protein PHPALM_37222 [Phytophthora palmivora]
MKCKKDHCLYLKRWEVKGVKHILIVCVDVDDLTLAGSHPSSINDLKAKLSAKFTMRDLGELYYLIKMEIKRDLERNTLNLSQQKYINDLLDKFQMRDCTPVPTPQAKRVILRKEKTLTQEQIAARRLIKEGLVRGTRPDIANAVRELSKYHSCYSKTHYRVAQRVLKYLKGTSKYGIHYNGNSTFKLEPYSDASFANAYKERKSVTGYVSLLAGACIT